MNAVARIYTLRPSSSSDIPKWFFFPPEFHIPSHQIFRVNDSLAKAPWSLWFCSLLSHYLFFSPEFPKPAPQTPGAGIWCSWLVGSRESGKMLTVWGSPHTGLGNTALIWREYEKAFWKMSGGFMTAQLILQLHILTYAWRHMKSIN